FCTPNAILTLAEYIMDYANPKVAEKGWKVIEDNMAELHNEKQVIEVRKRIERIKQGERDLYF
ncbi:MAG TPA: [FeFe] hydrogenase H-cluster radical SAM maturase HydG, partial [Bacteroidales bacterium]|nr:[FeFe] hydrogenase H-cluster radical SAM maturase HydG [Bacteroidales bacterium]